jgi:NADH-quinone oxidoreductase subunit F
MQTQSKKIIASLKDLNLLKEKLQIEFQGKRVISVCAGTGCKACSSDDIYNIMFNELSKMQKTSPDKVKDIILKRTGCHGFCENGPIITIHPEGNCYIKSKVEDAKEIFEKTVDGEIVTRLLYKDEDGIAVEKESDIPFYKYQKRIILENNSRIDPLSIEDYIRLGGCRALAKVLTSMTSDEVVEEIKKSNLRGRGGGGFPAGLKWETTKNAKEEPKYIIVNADEGDPGAFMDRSVLEGNPHSVLEGLIIAAYSISSNEGFVYVRQEYPLAVSNLTYAIQKAEEYGFLGQNILNSGFNFSVKINCGAGAFVCGEETALIQSIEGKRGMPRPKPPFPANQGLYGKPTLINNVETYANVPYIINNGAEWFKSIGTDASKGTKIFALTGAINNVGLVEVPMGITLRDIVFKIGGGIKGGKKFKAVQMGGPSGGCIPEKYLDIPLDYERVKETGAIMGSGGMIVLDENTCMVNLARYFMDFIQDESCGQCTPCRVGTKRMLETLEKITIGKGEKADIEKLEKLGSVIKETSLCGLGKTAPNPVLSTISYFRDEYIAHVDKKRCPAVECKEIISSPCQHVCPIDTEAQVYIALIAQGHFKEAFDIIIKDNPLPSVCGRVCHHPCEIKCEAGKWGDPVKIRSLKRFAADYAIKNGIYPEIIRPRDGQVEKNKSKKVAIIGSGPAGLMAGYRLGIKGYDVTIFEELEIPGGGLAVYIPDFRLPKHILALDIEHIKNAAGVEIKTNTKVGLDIGFKEILKNYGAVFIAAGAHSSSKLNIPDEDVKGVVSATEFLKNVNLKKPVNIGKIVGVIGGGNSAVDAARVAARLNGCESVTIIYRRTIKEMPAFEEEVKELLSEGIDIKFLTAPVRIITENGRIKGIECIRMELGDLDESGRRRPVPIKGSEFLISLDTLIIAIGEYPDLSFLTSEVNLEITKQGTISVNKETFQTSIKGVFAGGDVVSGPATIIEAMGTAKIVSEMIDKYLNGKPLKRHYELTRPSMYITPVVSSEEELPLVTETVVTNISDKYRSISTDEVLINMSYHQAMQEAKRCLRCDLETEQGKLLVKK